MFGGANHYFLRNFITFLIDFFLKYEILGIFIGYRATILTLFILNLWFISLIKSKKSSRDLSSEAWQDLSEQNKILIISVNFSYLSKIRVFQHLMQRFDIIICKAINQIQRLKFIWYLDKYFWELSYQELTLPPLFIVDHPRRFKIHHPWTMA